MIIDTIPHKLANHIVTYNNNSNQKKKMQIKMKIKPYEIKYLYRRRYNATNYIYLDYIPTTPMLKSTKTRAKTKTKKKPICEKITVEFFQLKIQ